MVRAYQRRIGRARYCQGFLDRWWESTWPKSARCSLLQIGRTNQRNGDYTSAFANLRRWQIYQLAAHVSVVRAVYAKGISASRALADASYTCVEPGSDPWSFFESHPRSLSVTHLLSLNAEVVIADIVCRLISGHSLQREFVVAHAERARRRVKRNSVCCANAAPAEIAACQDFVSAARA